MNLPKFSKFTVCYFLAYFSYFFIFPLSLLIIVETLLWGFLLAVLGPDCAQDHQGHTSDAQDPLQCQGIKSWASHPCKACALPHEAWPWPKDLTFLSSQCKCFLYLLHFTSCLERISYAKLINKPIHELLEFLWFPFYILLFDPYEICFGMIRVNIKIYLYFSFSREGHSY